VLEVASELGYLKNEVFSALEAQQKRARFFTWKLQASLRTTQ
jgi:hypothetical protein